MDLTHRFSVPAPLDEAWRTFNDLEGLAPCFPGATVSSVEGDEFAGSVKVKLGPIALLYNGSGRYLERDEATGRVVIEARGKDKRGNGTATATVTATFTAAGDGTDVEVVTDLAITGKPAQFGRGVISDVSDKLLAQFVGCVSNRFAAEAESTEPAGSTQPDEPPAPVDSSEVAEPALAVEPRAVEPGAVEPGAVEPGGTVEPGAAGPEAVGAAEPGSAAAAGSARDESGSVPPRPDAVGTAESPPPPSPRPSSPGSARTVPSGRSAANRGAEADEVNLLATVAPVLLKRYGPAVLGLGLLLLAVIAIVRRRSSRKRA